MKTCFEKWNTLDDDDHFFQIKPAIVTIASWTKLIAITLMVHVGTSGNFCLGIIRSKIKNK